MDEVLNMKTELQGLIDECTSELEDIKTKIQELKPFDKTRAYLTKYALLKASGTIEFVCRSIITDYFKPFNIPQVDRYLLNTVQKNASCRSFSEMHALLDKFDDDWSKRFKTNINERKDCDKLRQSSNSLVKNRNAFAHGGKTTATFEDIYNYYLDCLELVKYFDSVVHK